jgi:hypothetical protein
MEEELVGGHGCGLPAAMGAAAGERRRGNTKTMWTTHRYMIEKLTCMPHFKKGKLGFSRFLRP